MLHPFMCRISLSSDFLENFICKKIFMYDADIEFTCLLDIFQVDIFIEQQILQLLFIKYSL